MKIVIERLNWSVACSYHRPSLSVKALQNGETCQVVDVADSGSSTVCNRGVGAK